MACRNGPFGSLGYICVWYGCSPCLILTPGGMSFQVPLCHLKCTSNNIRLSYHVYSICILCWLTNLPVIVSYNSILNDLVQFIDMLYICIISCDIVH